MERQYICLPGKEFAHGGYKLTPIRDEDKYAIMKWRNEQIDILRQKELLTTAKQEHYFAAVINKLFEQEKPDQLLFSFLENDSVVGYGGLVHIDWESRNGEISFLTETKRNKSNDQLISDWKIYLTILKRLVQKHLKFKKIYTYAYDIRPALFQALTQSNFREEARLKKHISIGGKFHDVVIHAYFFDDISFRLADDGDMLQYFEWANDRAVRDNSFNSEPIPLEGHTRWFSSRINDENDVMFVASLNGDPIGQIRFNKVADNTFETHFSIDERYRGRGIGSLMIEGATKELIRRRPFIKRVIGKVKEENVSSRHSFLKAGYKQLESGKIEVYYFDSQE